MITVASIAFLILFGVYFSWREYRRPLYPTWLAVVIGTGATLAGITLWLYATLDSQTAGVAAAIAWASFIITGAPMAFSQAIKERSFVDEAQRRDTGRLNGNKTKTNTPAP
jgi:threonine/homoserine efflux transporter RhtA